jgi:hypothetical protein
MKGYSIIFSVFLSLVTAPKAHAFSIHQKWSCNSMADYQGRPLFGAPHVSLLCLLIPDRTGRFIERSCTVTQTLGSYPSAQSISVQFPLVEGVSLYSFLDQRQLSLQFDQYLHPFYHRAVVFTQAGTVGCIYSPSSDASAYGMDVER